MIHSKRELSGVGGGSQHEIGHLHFTPFIRRKPQIDNAEINDITDPHNRAQELPKCYKTQQRSYKTEMKLNESEEYKEQNRSPAPSVQSSSGKTVSRGNDF